MTEGDPVVRNELRPWLWPALLGSAIFYASSCSRVAGPSLAGIDKAEHFLIYGLLGTLLARVPAVANTKGLGVWTGVILASVFGITDEIHQSFTPGRSVEFADWCSDTLGAALAVAVYARWSFYRLVLEFPLRRAGDDSSVPDSRSEFTS